MLHELDGPPVVDPARTLAEAYAEVTTAHIDDREIEDWAARTLANNLLMLQPAGRHLAAGQRYSTRGLLDSIAASSTGFDLAGGNFKDISLGLDLLTTWAIRRRERVVRHRGRSLTRRGGDWFLLDPAWDAVTEDLDVVGVDVIWKATIGEMGTVEGDRFTEDYCGSGASPAEALAYALGALFAPPELR